MSISFLLSGLWKTKIILTIFFSVIDIDSESEEFEDAEGFDDDIFTDNSAPVRPRVKNLIPEPVDDETIGCLQFIENYEERYGMQHPVFFHGSLSDAVKEACHKPARERKLLVVYLHHDDSVLTNVFCGQLLGQESIINMFLENFVVYGWDLSIESNANLFLTSISIAVGPSAAVTVRSIPVEHMPTVLLVAKIRSQIEIFSVIHGNIGLDDLYSSLIEARETYQEQLAVEIREEEERLAREQVKMEQDAAYHESLLADRAKEEAKRQKEMMAATERKRLESEKAEADAEKARIRSEAESKLPPEPEDTKGPNVTKIRVRQPSGEIFERRFNANDTLQTLMHFVTSKGFPMDKFKLISSWPRRDLTALSVDETLQNLKLYPQEMVTLEERWSNGRTVSKFHKANNEGTIKTLVKMTLTTTIYINVTLIGWWSFSKDINNLSLNFNSLCSYYNRIYRKISACLSSHSVVEN